MYFTKFIALAILSYSSVVYSLPTSNGIESYGTREVGYAHAQPLEEKRHTPAERAQEKKTGKYHLDKGESLKQEEKKAGYSTKKAKAYVSGIVKRHTPGERAQEKKTGKYHLDKGETLKQEEKKAGYSTKKPKTHTYKAEKRHTPAERAEEKKTGSYHLDKGETLKQEEKKAGYSHKTSKHHSR
ncbi:hypothetical protein BT63DRAFT_461825 [Microthyrium microscopicum]|uniref:Uncharacterized protein n=1 Tax=Microthyrium microscopicum TaxID=703497 RepID=A0A6A6UQY0_9PEZI|nr:hypothetical protein BT63DRAFT_461825 [Microthyrium microscopicum]